MMHSAILSNHLGSVLKRPDNAIQQVIAIWRTGDYKTYGVVHRIAIYPVNSIIQLSINRGLRYKMHLTGPALN